MPRTQTMKMLTTDQIRDLSIIADQRGDDRVFALCAAASRGNRAALQELTVAFHKARDAQRARRAAAPATESAPITDDRRLAHGLPTNSVRNRWP